MSGKKEIILFIYGVHSQIADEMSEIYFGDVHKSLVTFISLSFLQMMFSKSSISTLVKATLLTTTFSEGANLKHFLEQSKATNIQPMTLSLIMSIATHTSASGWHAYTDLDNSAKNDDMDIITENMPITLTPNPVLISQQELPDIGYG
ncbi:hypothetical protein C1646_773057 [Rhizophagus diaphanus]|nr:hypothetical protein C1646_773057 [Rhizophagus diaphanus] [Rhizophagus sp. MUCL 43196]